MRPRNLATSCPEMAASQLNDCKSFPYNQLTLLVAAGPADLARRLQLGLLYHPPGDASMAQAHPVTNVEHEELPADLLRLVAAIKSLPDDQSCQLTAALDRVVESTRRRRRILSLVQDALSQLRLDMKYLMFDLEATRRERDEYHGKLEGGLES